MSKEVCLECKTKRDPYAAIVQTVDGKVLYICKRCHVLFDYDQLMHPKDCQCEHCTSQKE